MAPAPSSDSLGVSGRLASLLKSVTHVQGVRLPLWVLGLLEERCIFMGQQLPWSANKNNQTQRERKMRGHVGGWDGGSSMVTAIVAFLFLDLILSNVTRDCSNTSPGCSPSAEASGQTFVAQVWGTTQARDTAQAQTRGSAVTKGTTGYEYRLSRGRHRVSELGPVFLVSVKGASRETPTPLEGQSPGTLNSREDELLSRNII